MMIKCCASGGWDHRIQVRRFWRPVSDVWFLHLLVRQGHGASFAGSRFPPDVITLAVRWCLPLGARRRCPEISRDRPL